jgi:hypothetical protein
VDLREIGEALHALQIPDPQLESACAIERADQQKPQRRRFNTDQ